MSITCGDCIAYELTLKGRIETYLAGSESDPANLLREALDEIERLADAAYGSDDTEW